MPDILDEFEHLLEKTLENHIFAWLPSQSSIHEFVREVLEAIQGVYTQDQNKIASSDFLIQVSTEDYAAWFSNQLDLSQFSRLLTAAMTEAGFSTPKPPAFHIMALSSLETGKVAIQPVSSSPANIDETQYLGIREKKQTQTLVREETDILKAFLTGATGEVYYLEKSVVNIGRREDNDIYLADQRVSRQHAQIRRVRNQHILFDLNSTGGTFVNNRPVVQANLVTGDVISFAGVVMIYAEEYFSTIDEDTSDLNGTTRTPSLPDDNEQGLEIL
jgi:hypothetical protein